MGGTKPKRAYSLFRTCTYGKTNETGSVGNECLSPEVIFVINLLLGYSCVVVEFGAKLDCQGFPPRQEPLCERALIQENNHLYVTCNIISL